MNAVIGMAATLYLSQPTRPADRNAIEAGLAWRSEGLRRGLEPRRVIARVVNAQLMLGDVRPGLEWAGVEPEPYFRTGLYGALAMQLMAAVAAVPTRGYVFCDGCGFPYSPKRQPHPGERSFCSTCREAGVQMRVLMRVRRGAGKA